MLPLSASALLLTAPNQCTALRDSLGEQVYYNPASPLEEFQDGYHSALQRNVIPACIVTPSSANAVSQALKIIKQYQCIFATKSGGHVMFPGASNAPAGITIDLRNINAIEPDEEGLTTRVGTGNRWSDVYKVLEPLNRTVVGSRNSRVGVGGFTLGGQSRSHLEERE
jgi:FAD/FMN-containing dehydrogenase